MMLVGMIRAGTDSFHLVQTTSNLLSRIQPIITGANSDFLGSHKADPICSDSSGITYSDSPLQTWAYDLKSQAEINTVGIFFKDKPERPNKIEVRVGSSSDISKNPLCTVLGTQPASDSGRAWFSCGLRGNFVSASFCGDDEELEISAYSLHGINLRKIVSTST